MHGRRPLRGVKLIFIAILAAGIALAGCTNVEGPMGGDPPGSTANNSSNMGGGSEVHGTVEVTNASVPGVTLPGLSMPVT